MHGLKNHLRNNQYPEFQWATHSMNTGRVIRTEFFKVFLDYINSSFFGKNREKACSKGLNSPIQQLRPIAY